MPEKPWLGVLARNFARKQRRARERDSENTGWTSANAHDINSQKKSPLKSIKKTITTLHPGGTRKESALHGRFSWTLNYGGRETLTHHYMIEKSEEGEHKHAFCFACVLSFVFVNIEIDIYTIDPRNKSTNKKETKKQNIRFVSRVVSGVHFLPTFCWTGGGTVGARGGVNGRPLFRPPYWYFAFFSLGFKICRENISLSQLSKRERKSYLKRTHQRFIDRHHPACIIEFTTIIWSREQRY